MHKKAAEFYEAVCGRFAVPAFALLALFGAMAWAVSDDPFRRVEFKLKVPGQARVKGIAVLSKPRRPCPVVLYLHGSGGSLLNDGIELRQLAELGIAAVGLEYDQTNAANFDAQFLALNQYVSRQSWAITNAVAWVGTSLGAQRTLSFALRHPEIQPQLLVRMSGGWVEELNSEFGVRNSELGNAPSPQPSPPMGAREFNISEATSSASIPHSALRPALHPVRHCLGGGGSLGDGGTPHLIGCPVLIVHGERDEVFPVQDARRVAELLRTNGVSVDLKILPDHSHRLEPDRGVVTRLVAEYCRYVLTPGQPFQGVLEWRILPFLACIVPAFTWAGFCVYRRRKAREMQERRVGARGLQEAEGERRVGARGLQEAEGDSACRPGPLTRRPESEPQVPLRTWEKALRWVAVVLAMLAVGETAFHLLTPRFAVSDRTLSLARRYLIAPKMVADFDLLSANPVWPGKRLKILLEHVELAHYNRNELINWKVDEQIYRDFVLSPIIDAGSSTELNWRRPLWENFYPRIRKQNTPAEAAQIVIRFLRERVTIAPHLGSPTSGSQSMGGGAAAPPYRDLDFPPPGIESMWKRQITDAKGFEQIYVAALRSVGVGARLDTAGRAEFWTGDQWRSAPRPLVSSFLEGG